MKWFKKLVKSPSGETVDLQGVQTWMVYWTSRSGEFSSEVSECAQAFIEEVEARHFAGEIESAFRLIRHTGKGTKVRVVAQ